MPEPRQCQCGSQCVFFNPEKKRWVCFDCGHEGEHDDSPESKHDLGILDPAALC